MLIYLVDGRGSGKTSTAKILSRAVNCLNPIDGEPCNECEICKGALAGTITDITEIDAASNNGVDNIRDIREEVEFMPTNAKYRVYIIDEVHMLSTGAFNALLKTLEEPPAHVIFILATTEPQKLPITILSRCQRFDFKRISIENICKTLEKCASKIGIEIEDNAIKLIARMSDGAMRDAYSILDRCMSDGETKITEAKVRELAGIPEFEYLKTFSELLIEKNTEKLVDFMEQSIIQAGAREVFLIEEIKFLRDILILKTSNNLSNFNDKEIESMQHIGDSIENKLLISLISKLSGVQNEMKWSSDIEVTFETGILRVAIENIDNQIHTPENINDSLKNKILTKLKESSKMRVYALLANSNIEEAEDNLLHINFNSFLDETSKQYLQQEETNKALKEAVINAIQKDIKIKYVFLK